jgi:hypothetical protein
MFISSTKYTARENKKPEDDYVVDPILILY